MILIVSIGIVIIFFFLSDLITKRYLLHKKIKQFREEIDFLTYFNTKQDRILYIGTGEADPKHFDPVKSNLRDLLKSGGFIKILAGPIFVVKTGNWLKHFFLRKAENIRYERLHPLFWLAHECPERVEIYKTIQVQKDLQQNRRFRIPYHFVISNVEGRSILMEKEHVELGTAANWRIEKWHTPQLENLRAKIIGMFNTVRAADEVIEGKLSFRAGQKGIPLQKRMILSKLRKYGNYIIRRDKDKIKDDLRTYKRLVCDSLSWWDYYKIKAPDFSI